MTERLDENFISEEEPDTVSELSDEAIGEEFTKPQNSNLSYLTLHKIYNYYRYVYSMKQ